MIINVTAGGIEYASALITDTTGQDLTAATFQVGLGTNSRTAPAAWQAPDVQESVGTNVRVKLLIDGITPGRYWLWVKITDTPEIIPTACTNDVITIV